MSLGYNCSFCLLRDELMLWTFSLFFDWLDVEASRSFREVLGVRERWRGFVLRSCSVVFPVMARPGILAKLVDDRLRSVFSGIMSTI